MLRFAVVNQSQWEYVRSFGHLFQLSNVYYYYYYSHLLTNHGQTLGLNLSHFFQPWLNIPFWKCLGTVTPLTAFNLTQCITFGQLLIAFNPIIYDLFCWNIIYFILPIKADYYDDDDE